MHPSPPPRRSSSSCGGILNPGKLLEALTAQQRKQRVAWFPGGTSSLVTWKPPGPPRPPPAARTSDAWLVLTLILRQHVVIAYPAAASPPGILNPGKLDNRAAAQRKRSVTQAACAPVWPTTSASGRGEGGGGYAAAAFDLLQGKARAEPATCGRGLRLEAHAATSEQTGREAKKGRRRREDGGPGVLLRLQRGLRRAHGQGQVRTRGLGSLRAA